MSQQSLAHKSGITPAQISRVISGQRGLGEKSLTAIAHALNISPITIFRKAGLLPADGGEHASFEDWQHLLSQLTPDEAEEIRQIAELKIERRQKAEQAERAKNFKPKLEVVTRWDQRARAQLSPESLWYATLTSDGMKISSTIRAFDKRHNTVEKDVRLICRRANVPYLSPHKLRHGHAVYGLKNARTIEELKAVSQNIMHASMTITDGIYANLLTNEV